MGNSPSTPLAQCLNAVCAGKADCVAYPNNPLYQFSWVRPYNVDIGVEPIAVIKPSSAADVAGAVKCATANKVKVQARSGGHGFA
jgi:FAD/FMN-containing dehydrogenase